MKVFAKAILYVKTIRRMKPSMVISRLMPSRKAGKSESCNNSVLRDVSIVLPCSDLDATYLCRFDVDSLMDRKVALLNETGALDLEAWNCPEKSHLWNFNLHYFEYCIPLAARWSETRDVEYWLLFKRLVESWIEECPYGKGDAWHPYTISLRLVNWLVCRELLHEVLQEDADFDTQMQRSMYLQYRHLLKNQEKHLLANHYFENLKTLVIFAALFGEEDVFAKVWVHFINQLNEQILGDGVHFERSLMYHKLVLEGILRVAVVLRQVHGSVPKELKDKAKSMLDALASLEKGMGKTPFFNDSADGVAKTSQQLIAACGEVFGIVPDDSLDSFSESGYYKLYDNSRAAAVLVDAGPAGPDYLLGHAHCDAMSYELSIDGIPVVANSGTFAYQTELRSRFRSTSAHNTMRVGTEEQLECWAEHRVAGGYKAISAQRVAPNCLELEMTLLSGRIAKRSISLHDGKMVVRDRCASGDDIASYVHALIDRGRQCVVSENDRVEYKDYYSPEFGLLKHCTVIELHGCGEVSYCLSLSPEDWGFGDGAVRI